MSFNWLKGFHQNIEKAPNYAEKTLAAYRLGMKAKGSIRGVRIAIDQDGCQACRQLDIDQIYHPDDAPHIPLSDCTKGLKCGCVYRPVMTYEDESHLDMADS